MITIIQYKTVNVDGLDVFYREAGDPSKPAFVLLHGFPSSSSMFRNLMPLLARDFHVLAPDLIGFGNSAAPSRESFEYTFENLTGFLAALKVDQYFLYVFDYGAPIGFRLAMRQPERMLGIVSQNGNIYQEGLGQSNPGTAGAIRKRLCPGDD